MAKALDDLRVIEVAQGWGGPICGRLLAELGAEVIKVEPPEGDFLRAQPPHKDGVSYAFQMTSANKKSVVLDPASSADREKLVRLASSADILLLDRWAGPFIGTELDYHRVGQINPELIYCSLTPFGNTGPLTNKVACDAIVQAMAATTATTGFADGPAVKPGPPLAEQVGAVFASIGILAALAYRDRTGLGQAVDISMHDCLVFYLAIYLPKYFVTGKGPGRQGNRHTMAIPWNSYLCKDGYVLICTSTNRQWEQLAKAIGRGELGRDERYDTPAKRLSRADELDQLISQWAIIKNVAEIVQEMDEIGIPAGPILDIDQLIQDPHFLFRQMVVEVEDPKVGRIPTVGSIFKLSETPGAVELAAPALGEHTDEVLRSTALPGFRAVRTSAGGGSNGMALEGIRFVELGNLTAGPLSTRILANLGADVIKVEALEGDHARQLVPFVDSTGYLFHLNNTDKKSVTLDLSKPEGKEVFVKLVARANVLMENFAPGAMDRLGLGYETLKQIKPELIYCSVNGFGLEGPYANKRAYDTVIQAMGGIMSVTGFPDQPPLKTGISIVDLMGGTVGALNMLVALHHRHRTGRGQYLDTGMLDIAGWLTQTLWPPYLAGGRAPKRMGNRSLYLSPHNTYPTQDGEVVITVETEGQWRSLLQLMGRADLIGDQRYNSMAQRLLHADEVDGIVARWCKERTTAEVVAACEAAGVPAAPILDVHEVAVHLQTLAREMIIERPGDGGGQIKLTGAPLKLSKTPAEVRRVAPGLGQHNREVLRDLLGYSEEEVEELIKKKVI